MKAKVLLFATAAALIILGVLTQWPKKEVTAFAECNALIGNANLSTVACYKTTLDKKRVESLEKYLVGVVAAEMPAAYGEEALKAQAVAARTYALREIEANPNIDYTAIGQAYISNNTMEQRWGSNYKELYNKVEKAVSSTEGIVALYGGKPILAAFCASSGGKTEDSGNVWNVSLPYLKSVDSHWDSEMDSNVFSEADLVSALGGVPEISQRTQAGYVKTVRAGNNILSGIEVRKRLNLKSACFDIVHKDGKFYINTRGYGHGVGMSQTGAGQMAAEGASFEEIISHYYDGCEIGRIK